MREYLLFRLYGPMSSWGDIAVGEYRPTFAHPTKSAIMGLLAAAEGVLRENPNHSENEVHRRMAESYGIAVCVQASGILLRDYHTIQTPPSGKGYYTRKEELQAIKSEVVRTNKPGSAILSSRDYRCDALYIVCVRCLNENPPYALSELEEKLKRPGFILYLGRKSCPPAMPFEPQIQQAENFLTAFKKAKFKDELLEGLEREEKYLYYWEFEPSDVFGKENYIQTNPSRRDVPLSRKRWQFEEREEHLAMLGSEV
jgi:CRISPR system Cascade subunit CasD